MTEPWTPTPEQVHAVIPTRNNGRPFDATSSPTTQQVATSAQFVTARVVGKVGRLPQIPAPGDPFFDQVSDLHSLATVTTVFGTAALVELGEFPEQNDFGASENRVGAALYSQYRDALDDLAAALRSYRRALGGRPPAGTIRMSSWAANSGRERGFY